MIRPRRRIGLRLLSAPTEEGVEVLRYRSMNRQSLVSLTILFLASVGLAQTAPSSPASHASPSPQTQPSPRPTPSPQITPEGPRARVEIEAPEHDHKLTPAEAEELLASVDQVLHFVSQDTLLPIKRSVKKKIVDRDQVEKYLSEKFESDIDRIRFERSELVLKKFGLLPRSFNLHNFLIKLLTEQIAGYYDEKSRTMNLLDWVAPDMQKAVMAHELTHALQDQSYDLDKMSKHEEEIEKHGLENLKALLDNDEQSTCRSAVLEGQGMIVLLDYMLAPAGKSVENSPRIVDMMQSSMEKDKGSPIFDSAPPLLQEELIFPYRQGTNFIKELLLAGGKKLAYTGVLDRMPQTTREIMEPKEYLAGHRVPPLYLPDLSFLKKDYEPYDAGAVGEFDVNVLVKIYATEAQAKYLSPEWRGGAYYAAGRRGVKPPDNNSTAHVGLYYISKWASAGAAEEFARIYASALPQRYNGLKHLPSDAAKPGLDRYTSDDGPIFIQHTKNMVVAVESFDQENAEKLIEAGVKQGQ